MFLKKQTQFSSLAGESASVQGASPRPHHALPGREGQELRQIRGDARGPGRPGRLRLREYRGCESAAEKAARGARPAENQRLSQQSRQSRHV